MTQHKTRAELLQEAMNGLLECYAKGWKMMGYNAPFDGQAAVIAARSSPATAVSLNALLEEFLGDWIDMDWSQSSFETQAEVMQARVEIAVDRRGL